MLASVLLGRLPPDLRLIVGHKTADAELTLRSLQEVVEEELMARERTINPNQSQPDLVMRSHHVQPLPPFCLVFSLNPSAVIVSSCMHPLNVLLSLT